MKNIRYLLHRLFEIHWWTPFEFGRLCGTAYKYAGVFNPYYTKVRHCRICNLYNEERM